MASHSLPGSSQANSGSPPAIKSSYSKSPMGELDPVYKLSAASMTLMGADDVRKDNALLMVGAISGRSEEHTSELQSLMRSSYAVFFLKKNKMIIILLLFY